ncbi:Uncharacterised protein [Streptococcus pneumoniae]|nr:Uncharacterised protein [Streptococcus pneumoniae]
MMEYIYLVIIVGIGLWSLVNKLDDHAEMKQKERADGKQCRTDESEKFR